jgi:hypothetical protein
MNRRRIAMLAIALALLIPGSLLMVRIAGIGPEVSRLLRELELHTGHPIRVAQVRFFPLAGLAIQLKDVEAGPFDAAGHPLLAVREIILGISPELVLRGTPQFSSMVMMEPQLHLSSLSVPPVPSFPAPPTSGSIPPSLYSVHHILRAMEPLRTRLQHFRATNQIAIGRVVVHDGAVFTGEVPADITQRRTSSPPVLDHLEIYMAGFSWRYATPLRISGRMHTLPFTVMGQVGPLPASMNLLDMRMLLNLEAKVVGERTLGALLPETWHPFRAARGYAAVSLRGNGRKGFQATTHIALDQLTPIVPGHSLPASRVMWRSRSTLRVAEENATALARLDDGTLYINDTEWIRFTGMARFTDTTRFVLNAVTLRPLELDPWFSPVPSFDGIVAHGPVTGQVRITREDPDWIDLLVQGDMSAATIGWERFHKPPGTPMTLEIDGRLHHTSHDMDLRHGLLSVLPAPSSDQNQIEVSGRIGKETSLHGVGRIDSATIATYLPTLAHSFPDGLAVQLDIKNNVYTHNRSIHGWMYADRIAWGSAATLRTCRAEIDQFEETLLLPYLECYLGDGMLRGAGKIRSLQTGSPEYELAGSFQSIDTRHLAGTPVDHTMLSRLPLLAGPVAIHGELSGYGTIRGALGDTHPDADILAHVQPPSIAQLHITMPQGHLEGITFAPPIVRTDERPADTQPLIAVYPGATLPFERGSVNLFLEHNRLAWFDLQLHHQDLLISGDGLTDLDTGRTQHHFRILSEWWSDPSPLHRNAVVTGP